MTHEVLQKKLVTAIEKKLADLIANQPQLSLLLSEAMHYSCLNGGKRIRPLLTIATGMMYNIPEEISVSVGCAIELIHCYSLIHDDLPAMDNDDLRRGKPTCHKKYNEAIAILAGDALQSLAFETLSSTDLNITQTAKLKIINQLAKSSGLSGMAGGQALDLINTGLAITQQQLQQMHIMKTGALINTSIISGYLANNSFDITLYQKLSDTATKLGLLFQVIDDIIDITSNTQILGKTAHKDLDNNKATYVTILGIEKSNQYANMLYSEIKNSLTKYTNADFLLYLIDLIYFRNK
ncbi:MAG: polyprenyl synthetase family protein [Proteobacteria bacterium]|jgi:farnesyl diphosphate synthase|nr:polyprenyl synthetase family protein [Pseudomonadota bacterium]